VAQKSKKEEKKRIPARNLMAFLEKQGKRNSFAKKRKKEEKEMCTCEELDGLFGNVLLLRSLRVA
jgi:hypothetical protein